MGLTAGEIHWITGQWLKALPTTDRTHDHIIARRAPAADDAALRAKSLEALFDVES